MNLRSENHRQTGCGSPDTIQRFAGLLILMETTIATMIVVGMFAAASQPLSWSGILQIVLCAGLGLLLWLADAKLRVDESFAAEGTGKFAGLREAREQT